jgi:uncharacterized membrane protein YadS
MSGMNETHSSGGEFALQEDWWSVILGVCIVGVAYVSFVLGGSLNWFAVAPVSWSTQADLMAQLTRDAPRYLVQFVTLLALFTLVARALGQDARSFAAGFVIVYAVSFAILVIGAQELPQLYSVEPPLIALAAGMLIANLTRPPARLSEAFRVEFYIKIGVVLLGATMPLTLLLWAGPIAVAQASIVSIVTFLVIYRTAGFLELDRKLGALLAVGGAICGVSAVIAIAGAIRARREHMSIAITSVVLWSIAMILVLPLLARAWYLPASIGGAWIGTSEFADAAGFVAAQTYGAIARSGAVAGTPDQALWAYTLLKVVGRDPWIGIWAVVLSFMAVTRWDATTPRRHVSLLDIWRRFPKFILGLFAASLLATFASHDLSYAEYDTLVRPAFIAPLANLRAWVFTFSFLSIGLTTRLRGLSRIGGEAFIAFATGVLVNVVIGFLLSAVVFQSYWLQLGAGPL